MEHPQTPPSRREQAEKLAAELTQLRNALLKLSLCLKDLQFELDQSGPRSSEKIAQEALQKFTRASPPGGDTKPNSHPSASER